MRRPAKGHRLSLVAEKPSARDRSATSGRTAPNVPRLAMALLAVRSPSWRGSRRCKSNAGREPVCALTASSLARRCFRRAPPFSRRPHTPEREGPNSPPVPCAATSFPGRAATKRPWIAFRSESSVGSEFVSLAASEAPNPNVTAQTATARLLRSSPQAGRVGRPPPEGRPP